MKKFHLHRMIPIAVLVIGVMVGMAMVVPAMANIEAGVKYPINENGQTYGTMNEVGPKSPYPPDLVAAKGIDGTEGYVYLKDLDGDQPKNPEEAVVYMKNLEEQIQKAIKNGEECLYYIPLYKADGETVIGSFGMGIPNYSFSK